MTKLRLAFLGTPDFSIPALKALLAAGHEVAAVYTKPPRPSGRGQKAHRTPVHVFAEEQGLEVRTPASLKDEAEQTGFAALQLDAAVVSAYGLILPGDVLKAPRLGCPNIHPSLLPRWRGAAPVERAIMAGDGETGVTIMLIDEGLDSGPTLLAESVSIGGATAGELRETLAGIGARLMVQALEGLAAGTLEARPQPQDGVTYAEKISKEEAELDWSRPAIELERQVRGLEGGLSAWFEVRGQRVKVHRAALAEGGGAPGEVLDDQLTIACGTGALRLMEVQRAGKGIMAGLDFLRGFAVPPGEII